MFMLISAADFVRVVELESASALPKARIRGDDKVFAARVRSFGSRQLYRLADVLAPA